KTSSCCTTLPASSSWSLRISAHERGSWPLCEQVQSAYRLAVSWINEWTAFSAVRQVAKCAHSTSQSRNSRLLVSARPVALIIDRSAISAVPVIIRAVQCRLPLWSAKGSWISAGLSTCVIRFFCFFVRCSQYMHHLRTFNLQTF